MTTNPVLKEFIFLSTRSNELHMSCEDWDPEGYFSTYGAAAAEALGLEGPRSPFLRLVCDEDDQPLYMFVEQALIKYEQEKDSDYPDLLGLVHDYQKLTYHSAIFKFCGIPTYYDNGQAEPAGGITTFWFNMKG